ncbi:hemerythrin domain-containing protein [Brevibacillus ginsengisoli]|uniref:hemerythrin domain-containing protein n=1 Tax=Brevibacillus ginsengisoli TaxID=363854 RepID=UPI003CF77B44
MSFGCGMGNMNLPLCQALAQLKEEHIPLRAQMDEFYLLAQAIGQNDQITNWAESLHTVHQKAAAFINKLDPHSLREEEILFPMMANFIGRESGPIAVMEYEHDQAKNNLKQFLKQMDQLPEVVGRDEAKAIAGYLKNAYIILTEHFMKEENVLFPMAEQILSADEKDELLQKFNEIS